jgi:hypothetical protein
MRRPYDIAVINMDQESSGDTQANRWSTEHVYLRDVLLERKTPFLTELVEQRRNVGAYHTIHRSESGLYLMTSTNSGLAIGGFGYICDAEENFRRGKHRKTDFFRNAMSVVPKVELPSHRKIQHRTAIF